MKVENGKIIEATDAELFEYWLQHFEDIVPYEEYKFICTRNGVRIVEEVQK